MGSPTSPRSDVPRLSAEESEQLAAEYGLFPLGERPPFRRYVADIWRRRSFLYSLASGQAVAHYQGNRLGVLWSVFNPAMLILAYYFVFGILLDTGGGVENFVGFLSIGIVLFVFMSSSLTAGSKAIKQNLGLVRALRFPRALMPLSVVIAEFLGSLPAFALLFAVMFATGETPQWKWMLLPVVVLLLATILTGFALILSRIVHISPDMTNFIPIAVRLLRYVSGVFFSISHYASQIENPVTRSIAAPVLEYQPFALPLTIARESLMGEFPLQWEHWVATTVWAVLLFGGGMVFFWVDEARYGRG